MARTPWLTPSLWEHQPAVLGRRASGGKLPFKIGWRWWLLASLAAYSLTAVISTGVMSNSDGESSTAFDEVFPSGAAAPQSIGRRRLIEQHGRLIHLGMPSKVSQAILQQLSWDFTTQANYSLTRAPAVVHLEQRVDADPMLGICHNQKAMIQQVPDYICQDLQCLWVEHLQVNIDLLRNPLRALPSSLSSKCPQPLGGQKPVSEGQQPHISFIVTMHNNPNVTAQCLLELFRTSSEVPSAEYILIDDGSDDDTAMLTQTIWRLQELFQVQIKLKKNQKAMGYGAANAEALHMATGKYIALINNDMYVVKGWLSAIMTTFYSDPKAGIIGPMFLGVGDLITEAGGLIFNNAGAANYARGREPHHEMYFKRKTDYISGACMILPADLYADIGGFDHQYAMGYYEDTDLAMSVRAFGLEVVFQPMSVVYHQEGTTFGTDTTSDTKRTLMSENKGRFLAKWQHVLQEKHCPPDSSQLLAVERMIHRKILWIDDIVPEPDRDSGSVRNINMLKILLEGGYHVTFAPTNGGRELHYVSQLRHLGIQVFPVMPPDHWMLQNDGKCAFDVIWVARRLVYEAAQGQLSQHCPSVPIVYDTVDLHFLRESRDAITTVEKQGPSWNFEGVTTSKVLEWLMQPSSKSQQVRQTRDSELYFIDKSQMTVVVSPEEVELIHHYRPNAPVAVISNIHDLHNLSQTACAGRIGTVFVGNMNHIPNRQAAESLIKEVLPLALTMLPKQHLETFRMHIVGANVVPDYLIELFENHKDYVVFHGHLTDEELVHLYTQVNSAVAPLLSGAGVKGKVNQAMKLGVPVVATPIAVEGMHGQDGVDCLIGASPDEFAKKIVQLHMDCDLWQRLVDGGRKNLKDHFSVEAARPLVLQALSCIGMGPLPELLRGTCRPLLQPTK